MSKDPTKQAAGRKGGLARVAKGFAALSKEARSAMARKAVALRKWHPLKAGGEEESDDAGSEKSDIGLAQGNTSEHRRSAMVGRAAANPPAPEAITRGRGGADPPPKVAPLQNKPRLYTMGQVPDSIEYTVSATPTSDGQFVTIRIIAPRAENSSSSVLPTDQLYLRLETLMQRVAQEIERYVTDRSRAATNRR